MFQREIQFIIDFSINKLKNFENKVSLSDLVKVDLHPAIIKYISGQLGIMINTDRQKLLKDSLFDYSGKSVQKYLNLIEDELKKTSKLDLNMITKAINISVSFNINHLVRPKFTILKFLFNKDEVKNVNEIKLLLNNFYYYSYVIDLIKGFIDKKKIEVLTKSDFEELYDRIDKILIETYPSTVFESHINGICDFINIGDVNKNKMQLHSFELFLGEKGLTEYVLALKENYGDDLKLKIDKTEILNFVKSNPLNIILQSFKRKMEIKETEDLIPENLQIVKDDDTKESEFYKDEFNEEPKIEEQIITTQKIEQEETVIINQTINIEENLVNDTVIDKFDEEIIEEKDKNEIELNEETLVKEDNSISFEQKNINSENNEVTEISEISEIFNETDKDIVIKSEDKTTIIEDEIEEIIIEDKEEVIFETMDAIINEETVENNLVSEETKINDKKYIEELIEEELKIEFVKKEDDTISLMNTIIDNEKIDISIENIKAKNDLINEDIDNSNIETDIKTNTQNEEQNELKESAINVINLMDEKEINKIIKNLFNNDYEEFSEHVEKMGQMDSVDETIIYINTYCNNLGISENKKEVVLFKKLITHHFGR